MHGWRARIGLLVPAVNNTMEQELWSLVPKGVTVSTARIVCEREGTADTLRKMKSKLISARSVTRSLPILTARSQIRVLVSI